MNKTKVISVRIDEQLLTEIDKKVSNMTYRKRNDLIGGLLRFASRIESTNQLEKFCNFFPEFGDVLDGFEFKYHRKYQK